MVGSPLGMGSEDLRSTPATLQKQKSTGCPEKLEIRNAPPLRTFVTFFFWRISRDACRRLVTLIVSRTTQFSHAPFRHPMTFEDQTMSVTPSFPFPPQCAHHIKKRSLSFTPTYLKLDESAPYLRPSLLVSQEFQPTVVSEYALSNGNEIPKSLPTFTITKKCIGKGSFGSVYVAYSSIGQKCAAKISDATCPKAVKLVLCELKALHVMDHPNIVKIVGTDLVNSDWIIYLECGRMDLFTLITDTKKFVLTYDIGRNFLFQIADALSYMHGRFIVHRDLKLDNIVVTGQLQLKIIDFGLSYVFEDKSKTRFLTDHVGSSTYAAPEIWALTPYDAYAADAWAMGIVFFACCFKRFPWDSCRWMEKRFNEFVVASESGVNTLMPRPDVPKDVQHVLEGLICVSPLQRMNLPECYAYVLEKKWGYF